LLLNNKTTCDMRDAHPITRTHVDMLIQNMPARVFLPWSTRMQHDTHASMMNVDDKQKLFWALNDGGFLCFVDCSAGVNTRWIQQAHSALMGKLQASICFAGIEVRDVRKAMEQLPNQFFKLLSRKGKADTDDETTSASDTQDEGTDDGDVEIIPASVASAINSDPLAYDLFTHSNDSHCDLLIKAFDIDVLQKGRGLQYQ
jgi:hypothetical protein